MSVGMITEVFTYAAAKGAAWQVLVYLADRASDDGSGAWPSVQTIVAATNLTHRGVRRALASLEQDGYIIRAGHSSAGTVVWNLTPDSWPLKPDVLSERKVSERESDVSERESDTPDRCSDVSERESALSEQRSPKPSLNHPANHPEQTTARERAHGLVLAEFESALLAGADPSSTRLRQLSHKLNWYWHDRDDHTRLVNEEARLAIAHFAGQGRDVTQMRADLRHDTETRQEAASVAEVSAGHGTSPGHGTRAALSAPLAALGSVA